MANASKNFPKLDAKWITEHLVPLIAVDLFSSLSNTAKSQLFELFAAALESGNFIDHFSAGAVSPLVPAGEASRSGILARPEAAHLVLPPNRLAQADV